MSYFDLTGADIAPTFGRRRDARAKIGDMTVVLSGGIDTESAKPIASRLLRDLGQVLAGDDRLPRVGILARGVESALVIAELRAAFGDGNCELIELDGVVATEQLLPLDALVVTDGDAAASLAALEPVLADLRGMVHRGTSFWGIGAGAAIAAELAIIDGFEIGGVAVAPRLSTDVASEVQLATGLGLIDITVLPGAAQLGRLGIGIAACEAGLLDRVIALDAGMSLVIESGAIRLVGTGSMWEIAADANGIVTVGTRGAE